MSEKEVGKPPLAESKDEAGDQASAAPEKSKLNNVASADNFAAGK